MRKHKLHFNYYLLASATAAITLQLAVAFDDSNLPVATDSAATGSTFVIDTVMIKEWTVFEHHTMTEQEIDQYRRDHPYLTETDYQEAADSLHVDAATIHAVIDIEAGYLHHGFWDKGKPVIAYSSTQFKLFAQKRGIKIEKYIKSHAVAFNPPDRSKYGSRLAAQQARFDAALQIDSVAAIQATFWGMFQIGGFNWKRCGTKSPQDFMRLMSRSEHDQLELFINFLQYSGLDKHLQKHDWTSFARGYNGKSYASHGYHTKLAKAYKKYSK